MHDGTRIREHRSPPPVALAGLGTGSGEGAGQPPRAVPAAPLATLGAPAAPGLLTTALRHALARPGGRVLLRVVQPPALRRRAVRALLQEAGLAAGGQVVDGPAGDLVLVGAEAARAERLRHLLERLVGPEAAVLHPLSGDPAALLAYAAGGPPPAPPGAAGAGPTLAGLDAWLAAQPLDLLLRRRVLETPCGLPAALRLAPDTAALTGLLGPLGADADLLGHALDHLAARLFDELAGPRAAAHLGGAAPGALHLAWPEGAGPAAAPRAGGAGLVAGLAAPALLDRARLAGFAAAGLGPELDLPAPSACAALLTAAPPGALLRLPWPEAACPGLAGLDPRRVILAGGTAPEARRWAAARGVALVEA